MPITHRTYADHYRNLAQLRDNPNGLSEAERADLRSKVQAAYDEMAFGRPTLDDDFRRAELAKKIEEYKKRLGVNDDGPVVAPHFDPWG